MEKRELTCIGCPMGCALTVTIDGSDIKVSGNTCIRGKNYAENEVTNPTRIVTSTVKINGARLPRLSVKTKTAVPKDMIFQVMEVITKTEVDAPKKIGDIIVSDIAGTGVDLIATKNID